MKYLGLGKRIKHFREAKGLSLEELAARSGVSSEELQEVEEAGMAPPIASLIKLSKALDINVADIFRRRTQPQEYELIRKGDRENHEALSEEYPSDVLNYRYELLIPPRENKHLDAYMVELPPDQSEKQQHEQTHPGEEFLFVLQGKIQAKIQDESFIVEEGDSLFLFSYQRHQFYNPSKKAAKVLTVIYPF